MPSDDASLMTTLLTGFGPFGNVLRNPTERLARLFENEMETLVLPTSFAHAPRHLLRVLSRGRFERVVMLGVASGATSFRVERHAHNWDDGGQPDIDGFSAPARRIAARAPSRLDVTVDVVAWARALQAAAVPATLSDSAGGYLCNHALFHALRFVRGAGAKVRVGFVHVPPCADTGVEGVHTVPFETHVTAVRALLASG